MTPGAPPATPAPPPASESLARAGASSFAVSVAHIVLGFATSVVVARTLGPEAKGSFNLATTSASLLATLLGVAGAAGITVAVARGEAGGLALVRRLVGLAAAQVPIALAALVVVGATPLAGAVLPAAPSLPILALMAVLVATTSLRLFLRTLLIGRSRVAAASWRDFQGQLGAALLLAGGLAALAGGWTGASGSTGASGGTGATGGEPGGAGGAGPEAALALTVLGAVLSLALMARALTARDLDPATPAGTRAVLRYGAPLYAGNVVQFLNYRLDIFIVAAFAGVRGVGIYALAVSLGQLLWTVSEALATALIARVAADEPRLAARRAARLTRLALLASLLGALALGAVAWPLVHHLYGAAFDEAVPALWLLLPGIVAYVAVKVLGSYVAGAGRPGIFLAVSLAGLAATITLDLTLIPALGVRGAAIASTIAYGLAAAVMVALASRLSGLPAAELVLVRREDLVDAGRALRRMVGSRLGWGGVTPRTTAP